MLTNEESRCAEIRRTLAPLLHATTAFHDFAAGILVGPMEDGRPGFQITVPRRLAHAAHEALHLYVRAVKQHRAVQILGEHGLGQDALANSRHLFETALALEFILRPRLTLKANGVRLPAVKGFPLSPEFRTRLYRANMTLERDRMHRAFQKTRGARRYSTKRERADLAGDLAAVEKEIGTQWTKRLKWSKDFSGVGMRDLAVSLGLGTDYTVAYRRQSWAVHPVTPYGHVGLPDDEGDDGALLVEPSGTDVARAIVTANTLLGGCVGRLSLTFGLGLGGELHRHKTAIARAMPPLDDPDP